MDFRNDIQGLRAIAVLLVFFFHLSSSWMPGGFIGVDIFFVISGYLVSSIIIHKLNSNKFSIKDFYVSRIKRIVPAYLFLLVVLGIVASFVFTITDVYSFRKSLFYSIVFLSNIHFASLDNYFGASSNENPLLHTWTLAVEMQFYLILPLLLMTFRKSRILNGILLFTITVLVAYSTYNISIGNKQIMYFSLFSRMPEFLLGVLAASLSLKDQDFVKVNSNKFGLFGLLTLMVSAFLFNESSHFPGIMAMIPCLGTVFILISPSGIVNRILSKRFLVFIGEISYSIYLWHWPIMAIIRYRNESYNLNTIEMVIVTFLTLTLSIVSYYLVERPLRTAKGLKFNLTFAALGIISCSLVYLSVKFNQDRHGNHLQYLYPTFGMDSHGSTFKKVGILGDRSRKDSILLIGDSHALVMKKYFDVIGSKNKFSIRTITNNTYPTIPGISQNLFKEARFLDEYNMLISETKKELKAAKLIIIQFAQDGKDWNNAMESLIDGLGENQRLIIISDFPVLDKNPVRVNRGIVNNKSKNHKYDIKKYKINDDLLKIIDKNPKCKFIELSNNKAFENVPFYKDTLMYYDRGHLNVHGATAYAHETEDKILDAINWGMSK